MPGGVDPAGACPAVEARGGCLLAAVVVAQGAALVAGCLFIPPGEPAGESDAYGFHKVGFQLRNVRLTFTGEEKVRFLGIVAVPRSNLNVVGKPCLDPEPCSARATSASTEADLVFGFFIWSDVLVWVGGEHLAALPVAENGIGNLRCVIRLVRMKKPEFERLMRRLDVIERAVLETRACVDIAHDRILVLESERSGVPLEELRAQVRKEYLGNFERHSSAAEIHVGS
jgi:hypothetical protein